MIPDEQIKEIEKCKVGYTLADREERIRQPRIPACVREKVEEFAEYLQHGLADAEVDLANPNTEHRCCKEAAKCVVVDIVNEFVAVRDAMKEGE
jgi:hypothetical protein